MDGTEQAAEGKVNLKRRARLMIALVVLLVLMAVNLAIGSGRLQIDKVVSSSMEPTLLIGDVLLGDVNAMPGRYDIVILDDPENEGEKLVKRIMGLPGDTIVIRSGLLSINGAEDYSPHVSENRIDGRDFKTRVPDGHIFVLGDNRNDSYDSLSFGALPMDSIRCVMMATIWPPARWSTPPPYR